MFSQSAISSVNISSSWKYQRNTRENESQTQNIESSQQSSQFPLTQSIESQTYDNLDNTTLARAATYDTPQLLRFLRNASEITIREITNSKSNALFNIINNLEIDSSSKAVLLQQFSSNTVSSIQTESFNQYIISSLSWNCNASVLGVAYAVKDHIDWCTHESFVFLWNVFKSDKTSQPTNILEIDSCVSSLKAHPTQPSVYAVATANGKIAVYNTRNNENEMLFTSVIAHQSSITELQWTKAEKRNELGFIISCGLDGNIFSWRVMENNKSLIMTNAFMILTQDLPRSLAIKGNKTDAEVGITSMSFNYEDPSIFIVGCHGGAIFQCSLNSNTPIPGINLSNKSISIKSAIMIAFAPHRGHINKLQFSPFSRNIFFSCSVDSELRIYSILQTIPLMVIHTEVSILNAQWSASRPNITAISEDGRVSIYCINNSKISKPSFTFSIGENINAKLLEYNKTEFNEQIAISGSNREIQIWNLSSCTKNIDGRKLNEMLREISNEDN